MNQLANAAASQRSVRWFMGAETRWGMLGTEEFYNAGWGLRGVLLHAGAAGSAAQLEVGDCVGINRERQRGILITPVAINDGASSYDGMGLYGNANLRGSFYNPNFLNFSVQSFLQPGRTDELNFWWPRRKPAAKRRMP